eukprot:scaffold519437_cov42-Prasinocladus_malaysianus.AAC.2
MLARREPAREPRPWEPNPVDPGREPPPWGPENDPVREPRDGRRLLLDRDKAFGSAIRSQLNISGSPLMSTLSSCGSSG